MTRQRKQQIKVLAYSDAAAFIRVDARSCDVPEKLNDKESDYYREVLQEIASDLFTKVSDMTCIVDKGAIAMTTDYMEQLKKRANNLVYNEERGSHAWLEFHSNIMSALRCQMLTNEDVNELYTYILDIHASKVLSDHVG